MFGVKRIQYSYNRNRIFKKLLGLKILEPRSPQWDLQRTAMIKKNDKNTPNEKLCLTVSFNTNQLGTTLKNNLRTAHYLDEPKHKVFMHAHHTALPVSVPCCLQFIEARFECLSVHHVLIVCIRIFYSFVDGATI